MKFIQASGSCPVTTKALFSFATFLNFLTESAACEEEVTSPGKHLFSQWSTVYAASIVNKIYPDFGRLTRIDWWPGEWPGEKIIFITPSPYKSKKSVFLSLRYFQ